MQQDKQAKNRRPRGGVRHRKADAAGAAPPHLRTPNARQLAAQEDAMRPTLCHSIGWAGKLDDGLNLPQFADPASRALVVHHTRVHCGGQNGCYYQRIDGKAVVLRAVLIARRKGSETTYSLDKTGSDEASLLFVDLELPKNTTTGRPSVQVKTRFWTGVWSDAKRSICGVKQKLLELRDGDNTEIYYEDGRVARVRREDGALKVVELTLGDQIAFRQEHAAHLLEKEETIRHGYHEYISIMAVVGKHSEEALKASVDVLESAYKQRKLPETVERRFLKVLRAAWPAKFLILVRENGDNSKLVALPPPQERDEDAA